MKVTATFSTLGRIKYFIHFVLVASFLVVNMNAAKSQCSINAGHDTSVCLNSPLTLTATTTGGTADSFLWTTIPSGTSTPGNSLIIPTSVTGTFTFVVSANFPAGCAAADTMMADTIVVSVNPFPVASFSFIPSNECGAVPVNFTNTSSGIGLSYSWNFGDPNSGTTNVSNATSPGHHFVGTPGIATQTFTVTLIVTSSSGCKDTATQQVTIKQSPGTELGGTGQTIYNGLHYFTTCSTSASALFNFTNQSSTVASNVSYKIIWGDGSPDFTAASFLTTSHTYTTGNYALKFIVNGGPPNSCPDSATYYVFVGSNPAVGLNNPGNTTVCSGVPLTFPISGTATNPPGTTYTVSFNDNTGPVMFTHPAPPGVTHIFDITSCGTNSSDGSNVYPNSFSAVIVASNPCGNSSSGVVPIYVSQKPVASLRIDPNDTVCKNNPVTFTNTSIGGDVVQNGLCTPGKGVWSISPSIGWTISSGNLGNDFGLSDPATWQAGSHILVLNFTATGTYTIKIKTGGSTFCNNDSMIKTICVNEVPTAAFNINQDIGCAPFNVNTINNSSASNCGANTFRWSITYTPTAGCTPTGSNFVYINGTDSTSVNPQFKFINPGVYTVNLLAIAPAGACFSPLVSRQITVKGKPVVSITPLASICQNQSVTPTVLSSCYVNGASYSWSFPSGSPATSASQNPGAITYNTTGTFDITVDVTNECGVASAVQPITVNTVTTADAGPSQNLCGTIITMAGNTPVIGTGLWTYVSGPNVPVITTSVSPTTTVTGLIPGTYIFKWTITNGICVSSSNVTIIISTGPTPAAAGPDQSLCLATSVNLNANTPSIGTGQWSYISGPAGYAITNPASPTTSVTGLIPGVYVFRWTTSFANCSSSSDDVQITIFDNPTISDAGADQIICSASTIMAANTPQKGNGLWSLVSGPNNPAIINPFSPSSAINGLIPGTYLFQWKISNGPCSPSLDIVQIIVTPNPTIAAAGPDQTICAATDLTLNGNTPVIGTGQWSLISGTITPTITNPSSPSATVTGLVPGTYVFQWTISNGVCTSSSDQVQIIINDNVTVANAGPAQDLCGNTVTMAANPAIVGTGSWSVVSGPNTPSITSPSLPTTTITGLVPGVYTFRWTITNGSCSSSNNVVITIYAGPTPALAGPDQNLCLATSANLNGNIPSVGTGSWSFVSGPAGPVITDPNSSATMVTGLIPGIYTFKWTVQFSNCTPSEDLVQIHVFDNPTTSDAGANQTICASLVNMNGNTPLVGTGLWTIVSGPNSPAIIAPSLATTAITGLIPGTYIFKWTITSGPCLASGSQVTIIVTPTPTQANAGPSQVLCASPTTTLNGNIPIIGSGIWSIISGPAGASINNPLLPNTSITGLTPGIYVLQWTISNGVCPASMSQVEINNLDDLQNQINAPVMTICASQTINIDGLTPTGGTGTYAYQWEKSIDGGINWTTISSATTQSFSTILTVSTCFRRKVISSPCEKYSNTVCITVNPAVSNNTIAANQSICINTVASTITGSSPTGGNNVYAYLWQQSPDGVNWSPANGVNTSPDYSPGVLVQTTFYRRIVSTSLCSGPQSSNSNVITVTVNQDAKALFSANPTLHCAPFSLSTAITVTTFPDRNGLYEWFADGILIASNSTGIFPGYTINNPGTTVVIKLRTSSQHGCKPDSMELSFTTISSAIANFSKTPANGCGPLTVTFTNTSNTINTPVQYFWNFGNGTSSTIAQPGSVVYPNSTNYVDTTYYITLKTFNGCDTTYHYDSVKVFPNSKARFAVDTTRGCSPFTLHITNTSAGNNTSYYWDFGDGKRDTTHSNGSFTHTYNTGAITTYTISLISENQCTRDTQSITLVVSPNIIQPFVTANGNQLSGCAPHIVTFNNSSVGASQLVWDFGDNTPVTITPNNQSIIIHQYNNPGNYIVNIHLRNDCSDTLIQRTITVYAPPSAGFNVLSSRICSNQSVSVNNTSTSANAYEWFWGDASSSIFASGQHTYNNPGSYTITLVAKHADPSGFVCTDTAWSSITVVDKIPAQITVDPANHCVPYTLNVNAGNPSGYDSIDWLVFDSSTSQGVYQLIGNAISHVYNSPGTYSAKLIVHTTPGCIDSNTYQFQVFNTPKTSFIPSRIVTCTHDTIATFTATTIETGNNAVSYKWFVNGSIAGTANPFSYQFHASMSNTAPVEFNIQSLAENAAGCGDTSLTGKLIIQPLPYPHIDVSPGLVQSQPFYTFTFKDTVATNPNKTYAWSMGDQEKRNGREITYTYGDVGKYKVNLLVTDFSTGCSAKDSVTVTVLYVPGTLYVPNAFYPNSRINDLKTFKPVGIGLEKYRLQIFDSWGKLLFETTELNADGSPKVGWDGKYNSNSTQNNNNGSAMSQDAFVWKIVEAKFKNGKEWEGMSYNGAPPRRFGTVTLFR